MERHADLSFGSQTGRTRSDSKGFSSKEKKTRRKKQEFHNHRRLHGQEAARPDPEEVRARTMLALDRLGHQVISTEPGGYDLQDWVRSLDSLLDDFQDKIGTEHVTEELRARRKEAVEHLVGLSRSRTADPEIERLLREEMEARSALDDAERRATARLSSLRNDQEARERDLKAERQRLAAVKGARESRGLFSRLLRSGPSTEEVETSVAEIEADLRRIEEEVGKARKAKGSTQEADSEVLEARRRLLSISEELMSRQEAAQTSLQLAQEREQATQAISGVISSMRLAAESGQSGAS